MDEIETSDYAMQSVLRAAIPEEGESKISRQNIG